MQIVIFALSLVCFILAAAGTAAIGGCQTLPLGLAILVVAFIFGGWPK